MVFQLLTQIRFGFLQKRKSLQIPSFIQRVILMEKIYSAKRNSGIIIANAVIMPVQHADAAANRNSSTIFVLLAPILIFIPISRCLVITAVLTLDATDMLHTRIATHETRNRDKKAVSVILVICSFCWERLVSFNVLFL